ncbi:MAG: HEPN domain-containing protein [Actinomycetota bacterium]
MGALEEAKQYLAKAREFLEAAQVNFDLDLFNAATSNAVTSGINAKDAICSKVTGRTGKSDDHNTAVDELRRSGPDVKSLAPTLRRLLTLKQKAQYQEMSVSAADAKHAVRWAELIYEKAQIVVSR